MRKEYRKVLKRQFKEKLAQCDPEFIQMKNPSGIVIPGSDIVFVKLADRENVQLFLILVIDQKRETFMLEIGWSILGRFPELSPRPSGEPTLHRTEFQEPEFVCRLGNLFESPGKEWHVGSDFNPFEDDILEFIKHSGEPISDEKANSLVLIQVVDAVDKIKHFGLPYLGEFVSTRRLNSPS